MGSVTILAAQSAFADFEHPGVNDSSSESVTLRNSTDSLYIGFAQQDLSAVQFRKLKRLAWHQFICSSRLNGVTFLAAAAVTEPWDEGTLTYRSAPGVEENTCTAWTPEIEGEWISAGWTAIASIRNVLAYGMATKPTASYIVSVPTSRHPTLAPYLTLEYEDEQVGRELTGAGPVSGYTAKNKARRFFWYTAQVGECLGEVTISGVLFRHRTAEGATVTEIDCGTADSYTLPGSAITADTLQWQAEITDSLGNVVTTPWYTLSTVEALSSAEALSPRNVMVDGASENLFRWGHKISTGTAPTASELQVDPGSPAGDWTALAFVTGADKSVVIPAGALPAGEIRWRVRTYNTEEAPGSWSSPATILVVAPPAVPTVSAEQSPRPLISWESSGQQGYQLRIRGVWESGSVYGTATEARIPRVLPDGSYLAEVRIVNEYGLWSDWGSAPLQVENQTGSPIDLQATAAQAVYLSWSTAGDYSRFAVERDGTLIAVTAGNEYTDHRAVGEHRYRVLGLIDGSGNYGASEVVTVTLTVETASITDLETGEILPLPYSTTQIREEKINLSRQVELTHFGGAAYPSAEIGAERDKVMSFEAAFSDLVQAARLEALVGCLVCLKAKNNEMVIGVLPALEKTSSVFWIDYRAEITQVEETEGVEL